jgi:pyruvate-formate lyase-activating enzyme
MKQEFCGTDIKVCPIQGRQLLDVRPEDIFEDFRICNTYRGGGGYDQFPAIAKKRGLIHSISKGDPGKQFVVQLHGCHLRCPYCYVTKDGIYGEYKTYKFGELLEAFWRAHEVADVGTFHMMGGAPMLQHTYWDAIPMHLYPFFLFTSDLLLTEGKYNEKSLYTMNMANTLFAINIKGVDEEDHFKNTGRKLDWKLFWSNFDKVVDVGLNFYLTYTNPGLGLDNLKESIILRYGTDVLMDNFVIELKQYDALEDGEAW